MHEMGLAAGILQVVLEVAEERPVARISVRVGVLQAVAPESLQFSFELVAEDTCAAAAELALHTVAAVIMCADCGARSERSQQPFLCADCQSPTIQLISGNEVVIEQIIFRDGSVLAAPDAHPVEEAGPLHAHSVAQP